MCNAYIHHCDDCEDYKMDKGDENQGTISMIFKIVPMLMLMTTVSEAPFHHSWCKGNDDDHDANTNDKSLVTNDLVYDLSEADSF